MEKASKLRAKAALDLLLRADDVRGRLIQAAQPKALNEYSQRCNADRSVPHHQFRNRAGQATPQGEGEGLAGCGRSRQVLQEPRHQTRRTVPRQCPTRNPTEEIPRTNGRILRGRSECRWV